MVDVELRQIQTDRLLLRPFRYQDVDDVFIQGRHPQWTSYDHSADYPFTRGDAEDFVAQAVLQDPVTHPHFAMVKEHRVIGGVKLEVEPPHGTAEFGCFLGIDYWGLGLTVEAGRAIIDWAFASLGLEKVYSVSDQNNAPRIEVLESLGMIQEAVLRSHRIFLGKRVDEIRYGVLREEWST